MNPHPQTAAMLTATDLAGMGREPGLFMLLLDARPDGEERLECIEVVRTIPGRRLVCRGEWQGNSVFAKLYLDAGKDWQGELQGLKAMHAAGIAAPDILYAGTADGGAIKVILLEPVSQAVSLADTWTRASGDQERTRLLKLALETIANHHLAGLEQRDIHLDNFMFSGDRLYTLDGAGIRVHRGGELSVGDSVDNLALFFAQFYPHFDTLVAAAFPTYAARRSWSQGTVSTDMLQQRVAHFRRERRRRFLKKIFRDCSAFDCRRSWWRFRVCQRDLVTGELRDLMADPDASLEYDGARYLKQGNTSTLWMVRVGERLLVVKRYNIKGLVHRISRAFRHTRAAVSWENAHRLNLYGIPTARPVALVENRFGPLRGRAWYISEFVDGDDASGLCEQFDSDRERAITACRSIESVLRKLARCKITHGDMKATNFILSGEGAVIIDLDAMREHRSENEYLKLKLRDLHRFMRNWERCPRVAGLFRVALADSLA